MTRARHRFRRGCQRPVPHRLVKQHQALNDVRVSSKKLCGEMKDIRTSAERMEDNVFGFVAGIVVAVGDSGKTVSTAQDRALSGSRRALAQVGPHVWGFAVSVGSTK